jgi:hypothetical protein
VTLTSDGDWLPRLHCDEPPPPPPLLLLLPPLPLPRAVALVEATVGMTRHRHAPTLLLRPHQPQVVPPSHRGRHLLLDFILVLVLELAQVSGPVRVRPRRLPLRTEVV